MLRTLAPLALILLVLVGTWLIWPRAESPVRVEAPALESHAPQPATEAQVDSAVATEARSAAAEPAPAPLLKTTLRIRCVTRKDGRAIHGVKVRVLPGAGDDEQRTDAEGRAEFAVAPGGELFVTAEDLEHDVSQEGAEVPALSAGETREILFRFDPPR